MSKKKKIHPNHNKNKLFNKTDPIFSSWFVIKLINDLPLKNRACNRSLVYEVMGRLKDKYRINPVFLMIFLFQSIRPLLWLKVIKFGKKEFRIPIRLSPIKQYKKCIKWIVKSGLLRSESFSDNVFFEFVDLLEKRSKVFIWRQNLIDDIKKNRHNVSYKW